VEASQSGRIALLGKPLALALSEGSGPLRLGLRPEALFLSDGAAVLKGNVAHVENLGSEVYAQVAVAGLPDRVVLRASPSQRAALHLGASVALDFDPAAGLVFDAQGKRLRRVLAGATPRKAEAV